MAGLYKKPSKVNFSIPYSDCSGERIEVRYVAKMLKGEEIPKGWISIEEHLPKWKAVDVMQGYSEYIVKHQGGTTGTTRVADHGVWYYEAKEAGITHWLND